MASKPVVQTWRNAEYRSQVLEALQNCRNLIFFDTETTGLSSDKNHIIEIAAIKFYLNEYNTIERGDTLHLYIRPPYLLPELIVNLTGITDEKLSTCPGEEEVVEQIYNFFGDAPIVAGHCVDFDTRFLNALFTRYRYNALSAFEVDTCKMARDIIPKGKTENYKLGTLAHYFGFDAGVSFHSAIDDIQVTAQLFQALLFEYIEMDKKAEVAKCRPDLVSILFWEGYRGWSRIYVKTSAGDIYFDVRQRSWHPQSKTVNLDTLDIAYIEKRCWGAVGCQNADQFAKFTGRFYF